MIKSKDDDVPADPVPTDVEIDSAVERLSPDWARAVPRPHNAGASQFVQRLAHGRSHAVILEIKRSPRKPGPRQAVTIRKKGSRQNPVDS